MVDSGTKVETKPDNEDMEISCDEQYWLSDENEANEDGADEDEADKVPTDDNSIDEYETDEDSANEDSDEYAVTVDCDTSELDDNDDGDANEVENKVDKVDIVSAATDSKATNETVACW